jgi:hypothetical protein
MTCALVLFKGSDLEAVRSKREDLLKVARDRKAGICGTLDDHASAEA